VAFIILHVYLTTTGHTPMAGIKSMIVGWDEVEVHTSESESTEEE
jgi:thiosulfate reductase cytochrome b subunit